MQKRIKPTSCDNSRVHPGVTGGASFPISIPHHGFGWPSLVAFLRQAGEPWNRPRSRVIHGTPGQVATRSTATPGQVARDRKSKTANHKGHKGLTKDAQVGTHFCLSPCLPSKMHSEASKPIPD